MASARLPSGRGLWVRTLVVFVAIFVFSCESVWATVGGSLQGTVLDPQGAVIPNAKVSLTDPATNIQFGTQTDSHGRYAFRDVPVGWYELKVEASGFRPYQRTEISVNTNSSQIIDISLVVGAQQSSVTVTQSPVAVQTSDTQLGEVITGGAMTTVPLNGRSFTDLLALQPGVAPMTTITGSSIQAAGASIISPSGYLNPGTISINGQREYANGFTVNDADVVERFTMGAGVIPNLDSIEEFRILTGNFDAEYGNYSGGRINIVTKSGSNAFHGSGFEFLRNTDLDAKNYFSASRGAFQQNQFGGSLGGPIVKSKVFFYADYQGTQLKQGIDTPQIGVPSRQDRQGDLSDIASELTGTVNGQYWASQLSQKLGYAVQPGEPYYVPGCVSSTQCVLPNATIPQSVWSGPAQYLIKYIPTPNLADNLFATSSENLILHDNKGSFRADSNTRYGLLSAYYFIDDYNVNNPFPTQQGGASVPGFNALNVGRSQLLTLGDTKTFGPRLVNEFHFSFVRDVNNLGQPISGVGPTLAEQGFVTSNGTQSIVANRPKIEGIENVVFNNYVMGLTITGLNQTDNTFEFRDNLSRVAGRHTFTFGGEFLYGQVNAYPDVQSNGTFLFFGSETGSDFADFLLGVPSRFTQGDAQSFYNRNKYGALFAQDSWRATSQLTFNYGLRWDVMMPWYEKYNQIQTLVPGQQSVVFPGAPTGLVFPTDPGLPRGLASTRWNNLSPRLGLAYSPDATDGLWGALFGGPGKTSVRAGFGRFFSAIEGVSAGVMAGDAPYGQTYTSPGSPLFSNPYITAANGFNNGQRFPLQYPPLGASASNPNNNINWANYLPINGLPGYDPRNVSPYSIQYALSVQRQLNANSLLTVAYVGSQAHHLLLLQEANPGNPALCLSLSQPSQVAPNSPTCAPFQESSTFTTTSGQVIQGTRGPFGPNFGSVDWLSTIGNSNFNALELTYRYTSRRGEFLAGYTYGKSLDNSSSISDQIIPGDARLTYGLSSFDIAQNFVLSYRYELPVESLFRTNNRWTRGWALSGITRFATGFPVTLINNTDNSLLGTQPDGVNSLGADLAYIVPGNLDLNSNPRNGKAYFNTAILGAQPLGTPGNVPHRFFHGPGMQNWDIALLKDTHITEGTALQFRLETFNTFNHAQFFGPSSVDGNISDSTFGQVVSAAAPRLVQLALKFSF